MSLSFAEKPTTQPVLPIYNDDAPSVPNEDTEARRGQKRITITGVCLSSLLYAVFWWLRNCGVC